MSTKLKHVCTAAILCAAQVDAGAWNTAVMPVFGIGVSYAF